MNLNKLQIVCPKCKKHVASIPLKDSENKEAYGICNECMRKGVIGRCTECNAIEDQYHPLNELGMCPGCTQSYLGSDNV